MTIPRTAAESAVDPSDDLALALSLADAADEISLDRFHAADLTVTTKPDMTPVSDADTAVERRLRDLLAVERPDDEIVGEEFGDGITPEQRAATGRAWIIDPIDGTKNYVRGVPVWATLIALWQDGEPLLGVVSAPALARRWWGSAKTGAWSSFRGGEPRGISVSGVTDLADASLSISDRQEWDHIGRGAQLKELSDRCWRSRGYGDFYSYVLVAEGAVDIAAEPELNLWDLAALAPIIAAAGGTFTTASGTVINSAATSALATNGRLHAAALDILTAG